MVLKSMARHATVSGALAIACICLLTMPRSAEATPSECGLGIGNLVQNCGFEDNTFLQAPFWTFAPASGGAEFYYGVGPGTGPVSGNNNANFGAIGATDDEIDQILPAIAGRPCESASTGPPSSDLPLKARCACRKSHERGFDTG